MCDYWVRVCTCTRTQSGVMTAPHSSLEPCPAGASDARSLRTSRGVPFLYSTVCASTNLPLPSRMSTPIASRLRCRLPAMPVASWRAWSAMPCLSKETDPTCAINPNGIVAARTCTIVQSHWLCVGMAKHNVNAALPRLQSCRGSHESNAGKDMSEENDAPGCPWI